MSESFEKSVQELEAIVQLLERGQPTLDESLAQFERGVALVQQCRAALSHAEARIRQLVNIDTDGKAHFRPFAHASTVAAPAPEASESTTADDTPSVPEKPATAARPRRNTRPRAEPPPPSPDDLFGDLPFET